MCSTSASLKERAKLFKSSFSAPVFRILHRNPPDSASFLQYWTATVLPAFHRTEGKDTGPFQVVWCEQITCSPTQNSQLTTNAVRIRERQHQEFKKQKKFVFAGKFLHPSDFSHRDQLTPKLIITFRKSKGKINKEY